MFIMNIIKPNIFDHLIGNEHRRLIHTMSSNLSKELLSDLGDRHHWSFFPMAKVEYERYV